MCGKQLGTWERLAPAAHEEPRGGMATIQLQRGFEELTAYAAYTLGPDAQTERTDRDSSEGRGTSSAAAALSKVFLLSDDNGNLIGGPTATTYC